MSRTSLVTRTLIMGKAKLAPRKRHEWTLQKKTQFCEALAMGVTVATAAQSVAIDLGMLWSPDDD